MALFPCRSISVIIAELHSAYAYSTSAAQQNLSTFRNDNRCPMSKTV